MIVLYACLYFFFEMLTVYNWLNLHRPIMLVVDRYPFILNWAVWKQQNITFNSKNLNFTKEITVWPDIDITKPPTYNCHDETALNCSKTCTYAYILQNNHKKV